MKKSDLNTIYLLCKILKRLKPHEQQVILSYLNDRGLQVLYTCIHNGLYNPGVKSRQKLRQKLMTHKKILRYLSDPRNSNVQKKRKLTQIGGSLSLILGAVMPIVADLLMRQLKK